jgi:hypothetical protein
MRHLRNRTVRWRLTLLLATVILVTSVVLLVLSYVLVNANLDDNAHNAPAGMPTGPAVAGRRDPPIERGTGEAPGIASTVHGRR